MLRFTITVVALLLASGLAQAKETDGSFRVKGARSHKGFSVGVGIGFTASPDSFLMQFQAPYDFGNGFALGPQLQLGLESGFTLVGATLDGRYSFDLSYHRNDFVSRLEPFVSLGLGLAYMKIDVDVPFVPDLSADDVDFMLNPGLGLSYRLSERIALESVMQFNIVPGDVLGDKFYYTWQMLGARYKF
jgi:opacity protein-like surface antigen